MYSLERWEELVVIEGKESKENSGYAQNGDMMQRKLRQLRSCLAHLFKHEYPGGVEVLCPDGTIALAPGTATGGLHGEREMQDLMDMNLRGWWTNLDNVNQYKGLLNSMEILADMLRENPFDGVIGFSQGATLATMLAALCEGGSARVQALAEQGESVSIAPPQPPFKFALLSCGYKGTEKYYSGFYSPRLTTPMLFDVATLDHMVEPSQSHEWVSVCTRSQKIVRQGGHWFPTNEKSLSSMVSFAAQALGMKDELRHSHGSAAGIQSTPRINSLRSRSDESEARPSTATYSTPDIDTSIACERLGCALSLTGALRGRQVHNCIKGIYEGVSVAG